MADEQKPATGEGGETTETQETTTRETAALEGAQNPDAFKRALDAERQAAKDAKAQARDLKRQLDEAREQINALTSERDELKTKLGETEGRIPGLESKIMRYEVAAAKGLDLKLASRLNGSTREELEADADELVKLIGNGAPADDLDGGARETAPKKGTPEQEHAKLLAGLFGLRGDE